MDENIKQKEMKKYYDESSYYEDAPNNYPNKKTLFNQYMIKNILDIYYPSKSEKIVDMGCGWGNVSIFLAKKGFDVLGIDYSKKSIKICKGTVKELNLNNAQFICKSVTDTKLESLSVDIIYCADLVEHLYSFIYMEFLQEAHRILKKNGKLIIYTPNPSHIFEILKKQNIILKKDITHVDYKNMKRLKTSLINRRFKIIKSYYIASHIPYINFIENSLMNLIPIFRRRNAILAIKK